MHDGGERLWGRGALKAVETIEKVIAPELVGKPPHAINMDLQLLELDGTPEKSHLGANVLLAVSMAVYRAHAYMENVSLFEFIGHVCSAESITLPFPLFNMINGGVHAQNELYIQEFLVVPVETDSFKQSMEVGAVIFHELGKTLKLHGKELVFGDEGGYAPHFTDDKEALDLISETIDNVQALYGFKALCALDVAASRLYDPTINRYNFGSQMQSSHEVVAYYEKLANDYPICSIEDGLAEDDWEGWKLLTERLGSRVQIVGDDLFVTHTDRIAYGIEQKAATAALIKPDQIGTVTETLQAIELCKKHGLSTVISHRSGETEDTFIADLVVGTSAGQIKTGGLCRSERLAKYNRLLMIEDHLIRGL
ncbi:MAG: Enolase [candidate division TM6 bacterium GW2011_GWF2_43_87]|nr:MAG: Enolase [candidate division TM6 bacterium GW2011_GWF2_43_87]